MTLSLHRKRSVSRIASIILRTGLGFVFLFAAYDKILHPEAFARIIFNYQLLPDALINITAIVLPWMELSLAVLLIAGLWSPGAVLISNLLLLTFLGALFFNIARGLDIQCGCFSTTAQSSANYQWYVFRDLMFSGAGLYLFVYEFMIRPKKAKKNIIS